MVELPTLLRSSRSFQGQPHHDRRRNSPADDVLPNECSSYYFRQQTVTTEPTAPVVLNMPSEPLRSMHKDSTDASFPARHSRNDIGSVFRVLSKTAVASHLSLYCDEDEDDESSEPVSFLSRELTAHRRTHRSLEKDIEPTLKRAKTQPCDMVRAQSFVYLTTSTQCLIE
jgi:hypothetical protein